MRSPNEEAHVTTTRTAVSSVRFTVVAALALTLTACGTGRSAGAPDQMPILPETPKAGRAGLSAPVVGTPPAGRPDGAPGAVASLNRRLVGQGAARSVGDTELPIGPGDLIELSVFEVDELSKLRVRVPMKGTVSLPLVGQVQATGRTAAELEDEIRSRLQEKFMHDPQVSVFIHEHNSQRVSVIGAVRRGAGAGPACGGGGVERWGSLGWRGRTTLPRGVLAAGGVKDGADWSDIRLYRRDASGKVSVSNYDLEKFEEGQAAPELQRNDVVIIGKHAGKAFFYGFIDFFKGALGVAKGI